MSTRAKDVHIVTRIHPDWQIQGGPVKITAAASVATTIDLLAEHQRIALNLEMDMQRFRKVQAECAWPVVRCAWCHRLKTTNGQFIDGTPAHSNITDGVCHECKGKFLAGLKQNA